MQRKNSPHRWSHARRCTAQYSLPESPLSRQKIVSRWRAYDYLRIRTSLSSCKDAQYAAELSRLPHGKSSEGLRCVAHRPKGMSHGGDGHEFLLHTREDAVLAKRKRYFAWRYPQGCIEDSGAKRIRGRAKRYPTRRPERIRGSIPYQYVIKNHAD